MKKLFTLLFAVMVGTFLMLADNPSWNVVGQTVTTQSIIACNNSGSWVYEEDGVEGTSTGKWLSFMVLTEATGRDLSRISSSEKSSIPNNCGSAVAVDDIDLLWLKPLPDDSEIMGTVAINEAVFDGTLSFSSGSFIFSTVSLTPCTT